MFVRIPSHATNVALAADAIREVLVNPPFHTIPGVFSIRDIGQPTSKPPVRSKFLFCSGMLTFIEDEGKKKLVSELGITKIFDLRSVEERENLAAPPIEGVDNRWLPMAREPRALVMADFRTEKGELRAMSQMYQDILVTHAPIFKEIFEHIRDESDKPALFHCAADKDHTDVLTALIMTIAGCDPNFIARRYTITRVGVEPARAIALRAFLSNKFGDPVLGRGLADVCSDHFKTMIQFLKDLKESYQCGVEGYVKDVLGFSDADLEVIRKNLIA